MKRSELFSEGLAQQHHVRLLSLLQCDAYERREVILSSGRHSSFYIDCRRVVLTAEGHFLVGWLLNHVVARLYPGVVGLGGMTLGADPLVSAASTLSYLTPRPLGAFYVRKQAKAHGMGRWIEGDLPKGSEVLIVEDVVTSGQSCLEAASRAAAEGFPVRAIVALVDRLEGGAEAITASVPLVTLYDRSDFER